VMQPSTGVLTILPAEINGPVGLTCAITDSISTLSRSRGRQEGWRTETLALPLASLLFVGVQGN
jgi:hypothetical protein